MAKRTRDEIDRDELRYLVSLGAPFLPMFTASRWDRFIKLGWIAPNGDTYRGNPLYVVTDAGSQAAS